MPNKITKKLFKKANKLNSEFETCVESLDIYRKILELHPTHGGSLNRLGHYLFNQGNYRDALGYFEKAALYNPKLAYAHWNIGTTMEIIYGASKESIAFKMKAIKLDPDFYLNKPVMRYGLKNIPAPFITKMRRRLIKQQALPILLFSALAGAGVSSYTQTFSSKELSNTTLPRVINE